MKIKKLVSLLLVAVMTFTLAACGESEAPATSETPAATESVETTETTAEVTNLVLWTWNDDAISFAKKFNATHDNIQVEAINVASSGEYETKVQTALLGGEKEPDIIGAEPGWFDQFVEAGFFMNLDDFGAQEFSNIMVDYVWEQGQGDDGVQYAFGYQAAPAGFFYRRDLAQTVFGVSEPEDVSEIFSTYENIMDAARKAKAAGYRLFASDSELGYCVYDEPWVVDGKVNLNEERIQMMELTSALYNEGLTAYASQWTTPWYQAMSGEVGVLSEATRWGVWEEDENGNKLDTIWGGDSAEAMEAYNEQAAAYTSETTQVIAYGLPAWGQLTLGSHAGETAGNWGFVAGPAVGFGGGGWFGISANSEKADAAYEFLKWMISDETMEWFYNGFHYDEEGHAEYQIVQGNLCSNLSVIEKHADDENAAYGGEKLMALYLELAQDIDYSKSTPYDSDLGSKWGASISSYKTGEMTKEEAIAYFYDQVDETYDGEIATPDR